MERIEITDEVLKNIDTYSDDQEFVAYKYVCNDYESPYCKYYKEAYPPETSIWFYAIYKHWKGKEPIKYKVGEEIFISDADTDKKNECGCGINVATLAWCKIDKKSWNGDYVFTSFDKIKQFYTELKMLKISFTKKDIACVSDFNMGKIRLHRCKVEEEIIVDE